jgi:hypothetical protein
MKDNTDIGDHVVNHLVSTSTTSSSRREKTGKR